MNSKPKTHQTRGRTLAVVLMLMAIMAFAAPQISYAATAGTATNASIVNVVKVEYKDASGTSALFTQSASATVTVTLLAAAPTVTDPTDQTVNSGATATYTHQLYSNANGPDTYDLTVTSGTTADSDVAGVSRYIASITNPAGTTTNYGPGTSAVNNISIGSTVILSYTGNVVSVPAGTLNGIAAGEFVIINGTKYKVGSGADQPTPGTAASYNSGGHSLTAETNATITLLQETVPGNGIWTAPASLSGSLAGVVISELYTVNVGVTAVTTTPGTNGLVYYNIKLTSDADNTKFGQQVDITTTFLSNVVTITKTADITGGTKPGDIIEYTVKVTVTGTNATYVTVTDAVPVYTTLENGAYNAGAAFAQIVKCDADGTSNCGSAIYVTPANTDTENVLASGNAVGTAAGSAIKFYLGTGNSGTAPNGGTVAPNSQFQIKYKVKIN